VKETFRTIAEQNINHFNGSDLNVEGLESLLVIVADITRLIAKPKAVHQCLLDAGIEPQRAEQFAVIWRREATVIVDKLKRNSTSAGETLENVDWKVSVQTGSSEASRQKLPFVELNLGLKSKDVSFVLTDGQLTNLYDTLENVQSKLDELLQKSS